MRNAFYPSWIFANAWAEAVGLGTTLVLTWIAAPAIDEVPSHVLIVLSALGALVLGTFLEGVVVGFAQAGVLRRRVPQFDTRAWIVATAVGAGVAWLLGMIPSTVMALTPPVEATAPPPEPGALIQYGLALSLGLVLGLILGSAQWFVLRRYTARAVRWIGANAVAWAVGMPLIFVGMDRVPWEGGPFAIVLMIALTTLCVGAAVGAIHGRVLLGLIGETGVRGRNAMADG